MSSTAKKINIDIFLNNDGQIKQIPRPNRTKIPVLSYLASKFERERIYSEKEVNALIDRWHTFGDYFLLRRLLIDCGFLGRTADGAQYRVLDSISECYRHGKNNGNKPDVLHG
ncbi:MAG TPA: transcriptional regulator [Syntrophomonas sp.]|jgi:hypothetical protein|nr:transcriptional regulator [Syntrophomonas sp.]